MNFKKFVTLYIDFYIRGMDKTCITIDGKEYVFWHYERNKEIAELTGVKLSFLLKVNRVCRGKFEPTKGIIKFIEKFNFKIVSLTESELKEALIEKEIKRKRLASEWQANRRKQPDYKEYRRKNNIAQPKKKAVKNVTKTKPKPTSITNRTLREMLDRSGGENTPELWLAYHSVATRLSRKFFRNGSVMIDDMISEAVLCAAMYFVKNANPEYNLFAYLTEICKRSFAASFNKLNNYDKVTLDAMFEKI